MTPNSALPLNFPLFTGRHELARYIKSSVPIYQDNPLIEALPRILTKHEAMRRLANFPPYSPSNRQLSAEDRLHCVDAITAPEIPISKDSGMILAKRLVALVRILSQDIIVGTA
jgi:hypothetical protein